MAYPEGKIAAQIRDSIETKRKLLDECLEAIEQCGLLLAEALAQGGKILFCGNGGSAADCQHLATELVIRYRSQVNRPALPGIALTVDSSMLTAGANDYGFENVFARGVEAYGHKGDVLIGISTSGNSENVVRAMRQAQKQGLKNIGLLGNSGGIMLELCDAAVVVPASQTNRIQECHITVGHIWCEMIEDILFPDATS